MILDVIAPLEGKKEKEGNREMMENSENKKNIARQKQVNKGGLESNVRFRNYLFDFYNNTSNWSEI